MATRYPRIATGLPGGIANKIYRKNENISPTSRETRDVRHREKTRREKHSRTSSDRSDLTEESDFETNSEIIRNFNNLDRNHHDRGPNHKLRDNLTDYLGDRGKFHSMLEERDKKKPSKPNHYVPFDPRESPRRDRRNSQGWSDSSQYEASNYNSETGTTIKPRLPRNLLLDDGASNYESSTERSNLSRAILSCVIILSIIILVILLVALVVYLTGEKEDYLSSETL